MRKKVISLLLAAIMTVGCLTGCGSEASNESTEAEKSTEIKESVAESTAETPEKSLYNVGSLPIVNEPVTLKVLTQDPTNVPYNTAGEAGIWEWLEEKTGIKFEVESYTTEELKNKLPLIMATPDEMPDLFFRCNFSAADVQMYGQNGQLLVLDEYIEKYGSNIQEMFDTLDYAYGASTAADGHIYALPSMNASVSACIYTMNSRFMENAGITETPTTLEELYDVFKAIKSSDANGDGIVGNEICWSTQLKAFKRQALAMVGIACYWPWQGCILDAKDDQVYFAPTSEEYKYLLSWLKTFYDEGMLDQELFTQTNDEVIAKRDADLLFMYEKASDPEAADFDGRTGEFYPVPLNSAVYTDKPFYTVGASYQTDIGAISAYTEYPEICMLVMDYLFSEEASRVAVWGLEGSDYKVVSENPWVVESASTEFELKYGPTPLLVPRWNRDEWEQPASTEVTRQRQEVLAEYSKMGWQNYVHFTDEESEQIGIISTDLGLYVDDYFVGFITGTYDLEKDWDTYVETCNSMDVETLVEIHQAAYDRFYQK